MGAELKSLKSVPDNREYMWHGDPAYWGRTSPVLFPIVGGLKDGQYRVDGTSYSMGQHGFARDRGFQLKSQVASEIWFSLSSDEETLKKYPYPFQLEIGYELTGRTVTVKWRVTNQGETPVWFSIGGHPGFLCPIDPGTDQTQYRLSFDAKEKIVASCIAGGLVSGEKKTYPPRNGVLPITEDLFDEDALVIEGIRPTAYRWKDPMGSPILRWTLTRPCLESGRRRRRKRPLSA